MATAARTVRKTILVADDNPLIRQTLSLWLEGFPEFAPIVLANNGSEAVEKAVLHEPDLAILDMCMPVMDGLEAARRLKLVLPQLPIIIFSLHGETMRMKREVLESWGISAVVKKEDTTRLVEKMRELLHLAS